VSDLSSASRKLEQPRIRQRTVPRATRAKSYSEDLTHKGPRLARLERWANTQGPSLSSINSRGTADSLHKRQGPDTHSDAGQDKQIAKHTETIHQTAGCLCKSWSKTSGWGGDE
jgi:hypothetical protein